MRDGKWRLTSITEIIETTRESITSQELFSFRAECDGPRGEVSAAGAWCWSADRRRCRNLLEG